MKRNKTNLRVPSCPTKARSSTQLVADKAYDSQAFRTFLRKRGTKPIIPERRKRKKRKGRPLVVGDGYKERWKIERCFEWMDNLRRIVVRYESCTQHYKASILPNCANTFMRKSTIKLILYFHTPLCINMSFETASNQIDF